MQTLPLDVIRIIFSYLTLYDAEIARNVCKYWKRHLPPYNGWLVKINFIAAIADASPQLIRWAIDMKYPVNILTFETICALGNIPALEEMKMKIQSLEYTRKLGCYHEAVKNSRLDVIQWLDINIRNCPFRLSVTADRYKNFDILQWLHETGKLRESWDSKVISVWDFSKETLEWLSKRGYKSNTPSVV